MALRKKNPVLKGRVTEFIGGPTGNHSLVYRHDDGGLYHKDGRALPKDPIKLHEMGIPVPPPLRSKMLRDVHERKIQREMDQRRRELEEELLTQQAELDAKLADMDARMRRNEMEPVMVDAIPVPEPPPMLFAEEIQAYQEQAAAEPEEAEEALEEEAAPTTRRRRS